MRADYADTKARRQLYAAIKCPCCKCVSKDANKSFLRCKRCATPFNFEGAEIVEPIEARAKPVSKPKVKPKYQGIPAARITIGRGCNWKAGLGLD